MLDYDSLHFAVLIVILIVGLALLCYGGDWLASGASGAALKLRISRVVVGLTVVSIATSMPELITAIVAGARGSTDLAVGNIVGSNLANGALILGIAAIITPVVIHSRLIRQEVPILLVVTVLFCLFSMSGLFLSGSIARWEGSILLLGAVVYLVFIVQQARQSKHSEDIVIPEELEEAPDSLGLSIAMIIGGGLALSAGADLLVGASVSLATRLEISEALIGLTIVAVGTSLPELAASVAAALKKQSDLVAGNIVGSNIFNLLLIGGGVASFFPVDVDEKSMWIEYPALLLVTVLLWLAFFTDRQVTRREGIYLVLLYCVIIGFSTMVQLG